MKNKKIAIVLNTSWNIYNFRLGLLKSLKSKGAEIVAIAPKDAYSAKIEELGIEYHDIEINNKGTNPVEEIKLIYDLYNLYKRISPDVLLHYTIKPNIYGTIAARMLGIPVISNISGLGTVFLNDSVSSKIARMMYRFALRYPRIVFYQNADDRSLFIKLNLVEKQKTALLPGSGIDTDFFKPTEDSRESAIDEELQFLFIARLVKDKGIEEFVRASRTVKFKYSESDSNTSMKFTILGSYYPGNPTAISKCDMKEWVDEGVVEYLGVSDDVKSVIATSDCVVLPSYREGLSRVLLEASSMEKPIVTTNVPGCRDVVVDGETGYLCDVKDHNSLADQMMKIALMTNEQRVQMGQHGRDKVIREFDENIVVNKYIEGIRESI